MLGKTIVVAPLHYGVIGGYPRISARITDHLRTRMRPDLRRQDVYKRQRDKYLLQGEVNSDLDIMETMLREAQVQV